MKGKESTVLLSSSGEMGISMNVCSVPSILWCSYCIRQEHISRGNVCVLSIHVESGIIKSMAVKFVVRITNCGNEVWKSCKKIRLVSMRFWFDMSFPIIYTFTIHHIRLLYLVVLFEIDESDLNQVELRWSDGWSYL